MDVMVLETQQWLNNQYGDVDGWVFLEEDGITGWGTIGGLTRALQHELGITALSSNFGEATTQAFGAQIGVINSATKNLDVLRILNGSLWCKGYYGVAMSSIGSFDDIGDSVAAIRRDLGLSGTYVDVKLMRSLLSMDAYVIPVGSRGNQAIREFQQWLNGTYVWRRDFSIIPTDGISSRSLLRGLLYAIQYEIGMDDATANGNFGPGTKAGIRSYATVRLGSTDGAHNYVRLCQGSLRFNGFSDVPLDGTFDVLTEGALIDFQSFMELDTDGVCGYTSWCALLVSCGDDTQATTGFDTSTQLTLSDCYSAASAGFMFAGRYTVGSGKFISAQELNALKSAGLRLFPIHQRFNNSISEMSSEKGYEQAEEAVARARSLGLPGGSTLFFCVDFDPTESEIAGPVSDFFEAIHDYVSSIPNWSFDIGVYGTRNVCQSMINRGYASTAFVAGMSWGWSGNMGFPMPDDWSFNQIAGSSFESGSKRIEIDKVVVSRNARAVSLENVKVPPVAHVNDAHTGTGFDGVFEWVIQAELVSERRFPSEPTLLASLPNIILSYLRKPAYSTGELWGVYAPDLQIHQSICEEEFRALVNPLPVCYSKTQYRDVAHWAASTLGYRLWGSEVDDNRYCFGDLGGWLLDLITIWRQRDASVSLEEYLESHIGFPNVESYMDYADTIADADAFLVAEYLRQNPGERLSEALREVYALSPAERARRFYSHRFGSSKDNVAAAFSYFAENGEADLMNSALKELIKHFFTSGNLPTREEAIVCGEVLASRLDAGLAW